MPTLPGRLYDFCTVNFSRFFRVASSRARGFWGDWFGKPGLIGLLRLGIYRTNPTDDGSITRRRLGLAIKVPLLLIASPREATHDEDLC